MGESLVGARLGNYELDGLIGKGAVGEVYAAHHVLIGKRVAVKVLRTDYVTSQEMVGRFFQEARAVNAINHPNIVDIMDYGRVEDRLYFAMELLDGETLAARLTRTGVNIEEGRRILLQCASALAASHQVGIIHRDLKPENIFLSRRGNQVKVLDFGLAKETDTRRSIVSTQPGQRFGTAEYMSPEQTSGSGTVDARSDLYSLGVIMYELWTGWNPFERDSLGATITAQLLEAPPSPRSRNPHLSPALEAICLRALEKDPSKRFQTADELEFALEQPRRYMEQRQRELGLPTDAESDRERKREAKTITVQRQVGGQSRITVSRRRPSPKWLAAAAGGVVVCGLAGVLALRRHAPPPPPPRPAPVAVKPAPPVESRLSIVTTPAGAEVFDGEQSLGTTPLRITRPRGAVLTLRLTLVGHAPAERTLTVSGDEELEFLLPRARAPSHHHAKALVAAQPARSEEPAKAEPDSDVRLITPKSLQ